MNDKAKVMKALKDGGYYTKTGRWNSLFKLPGDPNLYRKRVETIVIRNRKEVFVKKKPNVDYRIPGGSTEKDVSDEEQAIRECQEEAHINIKNIENSGITYTTLYDSPSAENEIRYDGSYTTIYVAEYDGKYSGHVDNEDQDPFILSGRWYSIRECIRFFNKEHKDALNWYLKYAKKEDEEELEDIEESYLSNYFGNRKLLKKISRDGDIPINVVNSIIQKITKEYRELSSKSNIRRERKRSDVGEIFHPILSFDFPDGSTITVALCFDDKEFTDGAAFHSEEHGNVIAIYPKFFTVSKESQVFCLLHEIGHVRLNHLMNTNPFSSFGQEDNYNDRRIRAMKKGRSVYPEINADLYAVLNGANMYEILNTSISKDEDNDYNYRFTNAELASRYTNVFKQYQKLRRQQGPFTEESKLNYRKNGEVTLYEMVYGNDLPLEEKEKKDLYHILERYCLPEEPENDSFIESTGIVEEDVQFFANERIEQKRRIMENVQEITERLSLNEDKHKYVLYLLESLSAKERSSIPLSQFGIPEQRKFPVDTKKHTLSAIKLFGHCDPKYRKECAEKILSAMKKFGISRSLIGEKNKLRDYM